MAQTEPVSGTARAGTASKANGQKRQSQGQATETNAFLPEKWTQK